MNSFKLTTESTLVITYNEFVLLWMIYYYYYYYYHVTIKETNIYQLYQCQLVLPITQGQFLCGTFECIFDLIDMDDFLWFAIIDHFVPVQIPEEESEEYLERVWNYLGGKM